MKKFLSLISILVISLQIYSQDIKKVAVLETVDKEAKLSYGQKLLLRSCLSKSITDTKGYEAYDRTDIDAILTEQEFQRTGLVNEAEIKHIGEMAGVSLILIPEVALMDEKNIFVTAKILDVESAKVELTENMMMGLSAKEMEKGCKRLSKKLFGAETNANAIEIIQTLAWPYGSINKKNKENKQKEKAEKP
ncbi:MAG: hypothetical protein IKQ48_02215 [Paludibacteraceae bacterium]|nr:hypothetical protein [Paludibacteraceae bacterium]